MKSAGLSKSLNFGLTRQLKIINIMRVIYNICEIYNMSEDKKKPTWKDSPLGQSLIGFKNSTIGKSETKINAEKREERDNYIKILATNAIEKWKLEQTPDRILKYVEKESQSYYSPPDEEMKELIKKIRENLVEDNIRDLTLMQKHPIMFDIMYIEYVSSKENMAKLEESNSTPESSFVKDTFLDDNGKTRLLFNYSVLNGPKPITDFVDLTDFEIKPQKGEKYPKYPKYPEYPKYITTQTLDAEVQQRIDSIKRIIDNRENPKNQLKILFNDREYERERYNRERLYAMQQSYGRNSGGKSRKRLKRGHKRNLRRKTTRRPYGLKPTNRTRL